MLFRSGESVQKKIRANGLTPEARDELTLKRDTAQIILQIYARQGA